MVGYTMDTIQKILVCVLLVAGALYISIHIDSWSWYEIFFRNTPVMHIRDIPLRVEIAESIDERTLGLSNRDALVDADGMLFVFPESAFHTIWMKDMRFPIDIIWIDEEGSVISIDKNITPDTYPRLFRPARPARYAVETNTHFSDTYSLKEGDGVRLPVRISSQ